MRRRRREGEEKSCRAAEAYASWEEGGGGR